MENRERGVLDRKHSSRFFDGIVTAQLAATRTAIWVAACAAYGPATKLLPPLPTPTENAAISAITARPDSQLRYRLDCFSLKQLRIKRNEANR